MKKKGFTLIELLAVIVILAIIALIAIPLVYNITKNSRKQSNERSIDLYANAIRNGISAYELETGNEVSPGVYTKLPFEVQYEGDVECSTIILYEDGKLYIEGCTVNGKAVNYEYGTNQGTVLSYNPQYYLPVGSEGSIDSDLPSNAKQNVSELDKKGYESYLGVDVDSNNKVTAAYACFTKDGTDYCLKYGIAAYETNRTILENAFTEGACSLESDYYRCSDNGDVFSSVYSSGEVYANSYSESYSDNYLIAWCGVAAGGKFSCKEGV